MLNLSINRNHYDKTVKNPKYYRDGFKTEQLTIEGLAEVVKQGYAFSCSTYKDAKRSKANFLQAELIGIDIDSGLTINEALTHPFVKHHAQLIYTSASHQKAKDGKPPCDRFRIIFKICQPIAEKETLEQLIKVVMGKFDAADEACKDCSRYWAGNSQAEFYFLSGEDLPLSLIEEAKAKAEAETLRRERQRLETLRRIESQNKDDVKELALKALEFIPPRRPGTGTYEESLRVLMALKTIFGEFESIAIAENWSPPMKGWHPARKIQGFNEGEVTAGTLFWIAQQYGFKFPEREHELKRLGQPDEPAYRAYCEEIRERERVENAIATEEKITLFKHKLKRAAKRVSKKLSGFITVIEGIEFSGNRAKHWLKVISQGKAVLDASFMGSGKSHAVPSLENDGGKVWYVSQGHRNPTVEGITDNFADLMPRSQYGYVRIDGKLIEANESTPEHELEVKPNCIRANLFRNLSDKAYNPDIKDDGKENPICATCPMKGMCISQKGWYRYDRRETLKQPKIRCDIQSMPRDYDYSSDIIIIDEPSQSINPIKTINTDWGKLLLELDRVRNILPVELYQSLDDLLQQFKPLLSNKKRYGLRHDSIISELIENIATGASLDTIIDFLEANPTDLRKVFKESDSITLSQAEKKKYGHLLKYANAHLRGQAYKETLETLEKLPPNGLIYLLKALRGDKGISLRVNYGKLTITVDNRPNLGHLNRAKGVIFLDATLDPTRLQNMIGLDRPIETIREKKDNPLQNLTVCHIKQEGVGSNQISDLAINRVRGIIKTIGKQYGDIATITHKCMAEKLDIDGYWFKDNRGSNDFQGMTNLLSIGLPYPNVGAIEDEYFALYGTLDGFEDYYFQRVYDEILQLTGRPRVARYPNQTFYLFMITPHDADIKWLEQFGAKVIEYDAVEICPQAGNRYQTALLNIAKAIQETGANTQSAIAKHLGLSRQAVSKLLRDNGLTLSQIIERVNCQPTLKELYKDGLTLDGLVNAMRDLLDLDPIELAKEVIDCIKSVGWQTFYDTWFKDWPEPLQHKVYGILWVLLTTEEGGLVEPIS